jgi:hypothetical protein
MMGSVEKYYAFMYFGGNACITEKTVYILSFDPAPRHTRSSGIYSKCNDVEFPSERGTDDTIVELESLLSKLENKERAGAVRFN